MTTSDKPGRDFKYNEGYDSRYDSFRTPPLRPISRTPKLDRYIAGLRHPMLCPRSNSYDVKKPCVCERGEIEAELAALKASTAPARQVVSDEAIAACAREIFDTYLRPDPDASTDKVIKGIEGRLRRYFLNIQPAEPAAPPPPELEPEWAITRMQCEICNRNVPERACGMCIVCQIKEDEQALDDRDRE